jgi:prolyl 4-hydroxylase
MSPSLGWTFAAVLAAALLAGFVARQIRFRRRRGSFAIRELPGFLTGEECDRLIELAGPRLEPAKVVVKGGRAASPARQAMTAVLDGSGDRLVRQVKRRMAEAVGARVEQLENFAVTRYDRFGYFAPHTDSLVDNGIDCGPAGERLCAMIVYLNDDCVGGQTRFLKVGRSVRPAKGKAIVFPTVDESGRPHPLALHAGALVFRGEKWIINQLVRAAPYRSPTVGNRAMRRQRGRRALPRSRS